MADNGSGGMSAIVAVVAIIAVALVAYFGVMMLRNQDTGDGPGINIDLPGGDGGSMDGQ